MRSRDARGHLKWPVMNTLGWMGSLVQLPSRSQCDSPELSFAWAIIGNMKEPWVFMCKSEGFHLHIGHRWVRKWNSVILWPHVSLFSLQINFLCLCCHPSILMSSFLLSLHTSFLLSPTWEIGSPAEQSECRDRACFYIISKPKQKISCLIRVAACQTVPPRFMTWHYEQSWQSNTCCPMHPASKSFLSQYYIRPNSICKHIYSLFWPLGGRYSTYCELQWI